MRAQLFISTGILAGLLMACSKSDDSSDKSSRLVAVNEAIPVDSTDAGAISTTSEGEQMGLTGLLEDLLALTPTLTLIGTLAPPSINAAPLQANDIVVNGSKVYMAYNTAGESTAGGIDVIDISTPTAPVLASQSVYSDIDINKVAVSGSSLYAVGTAAAGGAVLQKITLDGAGKITAGKSTVALRSAADAAVPAYAGTSVVASGSNIYAVSGNNGGLSILNAADLVTKSFTAVPDARDISLSSNASSAYVVTGKTATAEAASMRYNASTGAVDASFNVTLANAKIDAGKSTVLTGTTAQIVTAGNGGVKLLCLSNGSALGSAPNPTLPGLAVEDQVANAAAFGNGLMFVANGGAGVSIYAVNVPLIRVGCTGISLSYLGRFSLGDDASVNNLYYSNGNLVIATGTKGFKIVKVQQSVLSGLLMLL